VGRCGWAPGVVGEVVPKKVLRPAAGAALRLGGADFAEAYASQQVRQTPVDLVEPREAVVFIAHRRSSRRTAD
jgi:hypothetical protein